MRVIKPSELSVQLRPFYFEAQPQLAIGVLIAHPFDAKQPACSEQDLWTLAASYLKDWDAFDEGMPKAHAEYLVYGNYYAESPVSADEVQVQVGALSKTLVVTGQREWRKLTGSTEPKVLTELPISYQYAYGGATVLENPVGMGAEGVWLPQIEHPDSLFSHPNTKITSAGFSAKNIEWLPRKEWWGTYNERWQQNDAPGFARDIQWQIFQLAPEDQWKKENQWEGGEPFRVRNMHPKKRLQEGELPKLRIRTFALKRNELFEIHSKFETVWLYPAEAVQVSGYRAQIPLETFDGKEIEGLLVAYEFANGEKKPLAHYAATFERKLAPEGDEEDPDDLALRPDDRTLSELFPAPEVEKSEPDLPGAEGALGLGALAVLAKMKGGKGGAGGDAEKGSGEGKVDDAEGALLELDPVAATPSEDQEILSADDSATTDEESESEIDKDIADKLVIVDELLAAVADEIDQANVLQKQALEGMGVTPDIMDGVAEEGGIETLLDEAVKNRILKAEKLHNPEDIAEALKDVIQMSDTAKAGSLQSGALTKQKKTIEMLLSGESIDGEAAVDELLSAMDVHKAEQLTKTANVEEAVKAEISKALKKSLKSKK